MILVVFQLIPLLLCIRIAHGRNMAHPWLWGILGLVLSWVGVVIVVIVPHGKG